MSDFEQVRFAAILAAVSATACVLCATALLRSARNRAAGLPASAGLHDGHARVALPMPVRMLRVAVAGVARQLDARLPPVIVRALDQQLRRAGQAPALTPAELLLLGLPAVLLAVPAAVVDIKAAWVLLATALLITVGAQRWLRAAALRREQQVLRELPFHLDMLALALEAGATLLLALRSSVPRAPAGPLRDALAALAFDLQAGRLRADALAMLQRRVDFDCIAALTTAIREADRSGAGLARVLRLQAEQRRHERFHRAEKLAMQAPVRMLGPLVLCIFPCTFIVIGFVLFVRVLGS